MSTLYIGESEDIQEEQYDHVMSIADAFDSVSTDDYFQILSDFGSLEVNGPETLLYDTIWTELVNHRKADLVSCILVYKELRRICQKKNITRIEVGEIKLKYKLVVEDFLKNNNINCNLYLNGQKMKRFFFQFLETIPDTIIRMIDLVISSLSESFYPTEKEQDHYDLAIIPSFGRYGSLEPVLEKIERNFFIAFRGLFCANILGRYDTKQFGNFRVQPINRFAGWESILKQFRYLFCTVIPEMVGRERLVERFENMIRSNHNLDLSRTTKFFVRYSVFSNIKSVMIGLSVQSMIERVGLKGIVINSLSTTGRAILRICEEQSVRAYHIPHCLGGVAPVPIPPSTVKFVDGELPKERYQKFIPDEKLWEFVNYGRPYIVEMNRTYGVDHWRERDTEFQLLLATQPGENEIREEFVQEIIEVAEMLDQVNVVIKTHPGENEEFYPDVVHGTDVPVRIESNGLVRHIRDSHLTLTVASNVGIESIICGTPSIYYNKWVPKRYKRPRAKGNSPVLCIESFYQLKKYLTSADEDDLKRLWKDQKNYINSTLNFDENASEKIADHISNLR